MSEDKTILQKLRTPVTYTTIDGVDVMGHPDGALDDLLKEAADEIEFLRTHAGAVTRGDSFDDILRKTGPQKRGEAS